MGFPLVLLFKITKCHIYRFFIFHVKHQGTVQQESGWLDSHVSKPGQSYFMKPCLVLPSLKYYIQNTDWLLVSPLQNMLHLKVIKTLATVLYKIQSFIISINDNGYCTVLSFTKYWSVWIREMIIATVLYSVV